MTEQSPGGLIAGPVSNSAAGDEVSQSIRSSRPALGRWVVHPFLLSIYPILALFAQNAREVRAVDPLRVGAISLVCTAILWLALSLLCRDWRKAGLITSAIVAAFFTFETIPTALKVQFWRVCRFWAIPDVQDVPPWLTLICEAALLIGLAYVVVVKVRNTEAPTAFLNVFTALLIVIPVYGVVSVKASGPALRPPRRPTAFPLGPRPAALPDIYYIILDGYARSDVMKSYFGYDNTPFLDRLKEKGFYVASHSIANYCQTPLSLSASLNAAYLDDLVKGLGKDQTELSGLIGDSNVMASLRPLGYKFVTFATGYDPTEHPSADVYLSPHPYASGFERLVIDGTPLAVVWPSAARSNPVTRSRERTQYLLEQIAEITKNPAPTFTLAHVFCPHPPFVFGENGEDVSVRFRKYTLTGGDRVRGRFRNPADFSLAYRGQSVFITERIEQAILSILAKSPEPPIIILQSDHGSELNLDMHDVNNSDLKERMSILNAFYFPGKRYGALYEGISPVNAFRVVFNTYFGANLELLPDRSFFSTWDEPYRFVDVTQAVQTLAQP
jgi:hypothetical protein